MSYQQFQWMIKKLSQDKAITDDEIFEAFNVIDEDFSNSIEYEELKKYYCKYNDLDVKQYNEGKYKQNWGWNMYNPENAKI